MSSLGIDRNAPAFGESSALSPQRPADARVLAALRAALGAALLGKADVLELVLACLLARGHLLIEDRPGLGKTTLAKALAAAVGGRFARVQCTPDLLPADITGFNLFNQKTREFEFQPGAVFADVLLADEINRTTPRTQSALLEAMAERQVTTDNVRRGLGETFFVIATQNPQEQHGTYPLPEAQLDRFLMKLRIGYPPPRDELAMLSAAVTPDLKPLPPATVVSLADLADLQGRVAALTVAAAVQEYLVRLAEASRAHQRITLGLSPRGLLAWQRAAQAWAFLAQRPFVTPGDVQAVGPAVLSVRLGVDSDHPDRVIDELLAGVAAPQLPTAATSARSGDGSR